MVKNNKYATKIKNTRFKHLYHAMILNDDTITSLANDMLLSETGLYKRFYGDTDWNIYDVLFLIDKYHLTFEYLFKEDYDRFQKQTRKDDSRTESGG